MRGSPSCAVAVRPSAVWRSAVALASLAALATLAAWAAAATLAPHFKLALAVPGLVCVVLALSLLAPVHGTLRWDGESWWFATAGAAPASGELAVALDLGRFMLLRFHAGAAARWHRPRWIALERGGLEREWHGFRCAVFSPRPADGALAADAPFH